MLTWPSILCPNSGGFAPSSRSLSGGQSLAGFEQLQPQPQSDRWSAAFAFPVNREDRVLAMRALLTRLRGRTGTIAVPDFDRIRRPRSADMPGSPIGDTVADPPFWKQWPKLTGTEFEFTPLDAVTGSVEIEAANRVRLIPDADEPDSGNYVSLAGSRRKITQITEDGADRVLTIEPPMAVGATTPGTISASVALAAAINATLVRVSFAAGGPPLAGQKFSIASRLYSINSVSSLGSGGYDLDIWPWLRVAVPLATVANFTAPVCEMRLASDQEGADAMRSLELLRSANVTLHFDEVAVTS